MLTQKEIEEIKKYLENSNNPLYLFDDDGDGVCSYLLLKRYYKKGKGIPLKRAGPLDESYIAEIEEEKPDLIIILDKAVIKQEFLDKSPCDVVYIDHHPIQKLNRIKYYNPLFHNKDSYTPTSEIVYSVVKSDLWIAAVGCLFDYKIPYFIKEFKKQYPDLITKIQKDPGYLKYKSPVSKLIKIFAFNLKGKKSEVRNSLNAMEKVESPYEIINKTTDQGKYLYIRYEKLNRLYEKLLEKAESFINETKVLLFIYPSTKVSFTGDLATELSYLHQDNIIIVARERIGEMKLSLRHQKKDIRGIATEAINGLDGHIGGHVHAVGGSINKKDFDVFIERIKNLQNKKT